MNVSEQISKLLSGRAFVGIDLGCGTRKCGPEFIGIDALEYDGVDLVGDALEILYSFPDGSVDEVHTRHFLEHVNNIDEYLDEAARVIRPKGLLRITVPHFSNPFFFSDPTHKTPFGLYTLCYVSNQDRYKRLVPTYKKELLYDLIEMHLVFKSYPPRYIRHAIKKSVEKIVNISAYSQELYEENLCWLMPCYEIKCLLRRNASPNRFQK